MFSKNLKYLREKNGLDQMQFAEKLGRKSPSTVSEWEKGKYTPKLGVLSDIAHIFNVSIEEMMHVNLAEKDAKGEINIIPTFNELNRSNQIKTFEFAKNKLTEQNDKHILSSRSTAAGAPDYEDAQQKIIVRNEVPRGADEVVTIAGDSMEPLLKQGSQAFVHYQPTPDTDGQIVIVSIKGDGVACKMIYREDGKIRLASINEKYEDMVFPAEDVRIIGKVIISQKK
ncbi:LexA family transcriptional regulator [Liquorilactobacillus mali]|nr:LexA family transcriptional regulator [Liquorilactobacillus mali]EJF01310.1 putative Xre family DNA-binding protein [Liquorilactobacillus mali KCTC 3596 = DSM 20444]MDC7952723.1 helix-turn-helix domain-containing protein [Liquorilactobacillus mali]QFQ74591.1 helix-turn-helix domain-containing protein [Liquorilactobacillus mali]